VLSKERVAQAVMIASRADFGPPRQTFDPRIIQLAVKFVF
jgi:hypothetical protein